MPGCIHTLVQDADNGNAVTGRLEIDDVMLHAAAAITWPNIGATLRLLWGFGQVGAGGFDQVGVAQCLRQTPLRYGVIENPVKVALRPWAEPIISHTAPLCAA